MLGEEVDVVGDDHQVANFKAWVHATGSIRDEERLDAQLIHHTNRKGHLLHGVALVVVEATLHGQDVHTTQLTEDEFSAMAFHRRDGEVGDVRVRKLQLVSYL